jgi:hypothetical protein
MGRPLAVLATLLLFSVFGFGAVSLRPHSDARACGAYGPYDFDTLEAFDSRDLFTRAINLAAEGKAVTETFEVNGELADLRYQGLLSGPRDNRTTVVDPALRIPPSVYYGIAWVEANWQNADPVSVPWGGVGPVIRSFDCGYGIGQITSGMRNDFGSPSARQALIGTHFLFNIAEGMRILASKWNQAPEFRPIAGNGDPAALEDWYFAIWSYNGFAFSNHPLNPERDPLRGGAADSPIYHCYDEEALSYVDSGNGDPLYGYGDYTYQERVYGCMRNPPERDEQPLWAPVQFRMPDFTMPEVAAAFGPENFTICRDDSGFAGGCPGMDFPTSFPDLQLETSPDLVPPVAPEMALTEAAALLGAPVFQYLGGSSATLEVSKDGVSQSTSVTVRNAGTWIAPFRIRSDVPWIVIRHPGDSASRTLDASVAVGAETLVVTKQIPSSTAGQPPEKVTQQGYDSVLLISLDPTKMPQGTHAGTLWIEPLLGRGTPVSIAVLGTNLYEGGPLPAPVTPIPTPIGFRSLLPGLTATR